MNPRTFSDLCGEATQLRNGTTGLVGDALRYRSLILCHEFMNLHDQVYDRDPSMALLIRDRVGLILTAAGSY